MTEGWNMKRKRNFFKSIVDVFGDAIYLPIRLLFSVLGFIAEVVFSMSD